ncbi:MAG: hypothetical protein IJV85_05415 [Clostridia bacterium]|nr:hypothetical protein [Clostridia bacterium]
MKISTKASVPARRYALMKKRIAKAQRKSKWIGLLYIVGIVVLAAVGFVVPLVESKFAFQEIMTIFGAMGTNKFSEIALFTVLLRMITMVVVAVNVIKALGKLGWLFKRKASRLYGFNRNAYAMEDLGKLFASSFKWLFTSTLLILVIDWSAKLVDMAVIILIVALVIHFFCGHVAGNVSLFNIQDGISEVRRKANRFVPFVRNLIQVVVVYFTVSYFVQASTILDFFSVAMADAGVDFGKLDTVMAGIGGLIGALMGTPEGIVALLQIFTLVAIIVLEAHAFNNSEFDMDGADRAGRNVFPIWSLITGVLALVTYFMGSASMAAEAANATLYIAIIAIVSFIIELILRNKPSVNYERDYDVEASQYFAGKYWSANSVTDKFINDQEGVVYDD